MLAQRDETEQETGRDRKSKKWQPVELCPRSGAPTAKDADLIICILCSMLASLQQLGRARGCGGDVEGTWKGRGGDPVRRHLARMIGQPMTESLALGRVPQLQLFAAPRPNPDGSLQNYPEVPSEGPTEGGKNDQPSNLVVTSANGPLEIHNILGTRHCTEYSGQNMVLHMLKDACSAERTGPGSAAAPAGAG